MRHANMRCGGRQSRAGFTLMELLVVIGIIVILLALLVPSMSWIRFRTQCLQCASNLRQWGIACTLYAAEHDGFLPRFDNTGAQSGCTWDIGSGFFSKDLTGTNTLLAPYGIKSRSMYFCPLDNSTEAQTQTLGQWGAADWGSFSYIVWLFRTTPIVPSGFPKFDINGDGVIGSEEYVTKVYDSAKCPIMTDGVTVGVSGSFPMSSDSPALDNAGNHIWRGKLYDVNVLFVGGRVEARKRSQMMDRNHSPYPLATFY